VIAPEKLVHITPERRPSSHLIISSTSWQRIAQKPLFFTEGAIAEARRSDQGCEPALA